MRRWSLGTALLAAFAFGAAPLAAQSSVTVGPMAGVGFSSFSGDDADLFSEDGFSLDKGSRTGLAVGGFAEFEFGSNFAIEPQLLYMQKGARYNGEVDFGEGSEDVSAGVDLDYIQLPVLFKAELRKPDNTLTPSVFVGPAFGFQIGCSLTAEGGGEEASEDCPDDTFKGTDFSLVFGAGLEFNRFSLQGRYDMGLGSVADVDDVDVKNGGFLVTLGYAFRVR
jgi:hypothetical protein